MDVFEAIIKRHSVRAYLPDSIPRDKLEKILEAGHLAPSASHIQPWHFIVVIDPQKRRELSKGGLFAKFLSKSPVVIVGCGDKKASTKWHAVDTAIALQNMVLAATAEGLGTCWIGDFDEVQVKKLLRIPENFSVIALLAVGYPREKWDITAKALLFFRKDKKIRKIVSLEEFGHPFVS